MGCHSPRLIRAEFRGARLAGLGTTLYYMAVACSAQGDSLAPGRNVAGDRASSPEPSSQAGNGAPGTRNGYRLCAFDLNAPSSPTDRTLASGVASFAVGAERVAWVSRDARGWFIQVRRVASAPVPNPPGPRDRPAVFVGARMPQDIRAAQDALYWEAGGSVFRAPWSAFSDPSSPARWPSRAARVHRL